jgi:26S proteasome regulatory subunit N6
LISFTVRTLIDFFSNISHSEAVQVKVLEENIQWAKDEKRIFLKQSLETRLVALQLETQAFRPALSLIDELLKELKRLDDKLILTEVHLLESRVYRGIGNFPKSKASKRCLIVTHLINLSETLGCFNFCTHSG